jgi:hypothetical protein
MSLSKRARDKRAAQYFEAGKNSGLEISQTSDLQTSNNGAAESHRLDQQFRILGIAAGTPVGIPHRP